MLHKYWIAGDYLIFCALAANDGWILKTNVNQNDAIWFEWICLFFQMTFLIRYELVFNDAAFVEMKKISLMLGALDRKLDWM